MDCIAIISVSLLSAYKLILIYIKVYICSYFIGKCPMYCIQYHDNCTVLYCIKKTKDPLMECFIVQPSNVSNYCIFLCDTQATLPLVLHVVQYCKFIQTGRSNTSASLQFLFPPKYTLVTGKEEVEFNFGKDRILHSSVQLIILVSELSHPLHSFINSFTNFILCAYRFQKMRESAVVIQKYYRAYAQKRRYQHMRVGYMRLQALIRSRVVSHRFKHLRGHIVSLQVRFNQCNEGFTLQYIFSC